MGTRDDAIASTFRRRADTPTLRLAAYRLAAEGVPRSRIAAAFDVSERTVYNWLARFEVGDPAKAAEDDPRPGAPAALSEDDRAALLAELVASPRAAGYAVADWTTTLASEHISERYGVSYSERHVRRLLSNAKNEIN